MARPDTPGERPHGGLADKRQAILAGALTVFARDGYSRASVDTIAAEAGVSTRTIYNHFACKLQLFQTVIQDSTTCVAEAQIAIIDRHLGKLIDLEQDLIEFGRAMATPMTDYREHFALIRQINAEVGHIPQAVIDAWQEAGPTRVTRELARCLEQLAERGYLHVDNPDRAAVHLMLLVSGALPSTTASEPLAAPRYPRSSPPACTSSYTATSPDALLTTGQRCRQRSLAAATDARYSAYGRS